MNPQNEHFLYELGHHHIHKPTTSDHTHQPESTSGWKAKLDNSARFISHLSKIRIQVTFETAEPRPDGC